MGLLIGQHVGIARVPSYLFTFVLSQNGTEDAESIYLLLIAHLTSCGF